MTTNTPVRLRTGCYIELFDGRIRGPLIEYWKNRASPRFFLEFCHDSDLRQGWSFEGQVGPIECNRDVMRIVPAEEAKRLASTKEVRIPAPRTNIASFWLKGPAARDTLKETFRTMAVLPPEEPLSFEPRQDADPDTIADVVARSLPAPRSYFDASEEFKQKLLPIAAALLKRFHIYERLPTDPPADENGSAIHASENAQGGLSDFKQCSHPAAVHALIDED